MAPTLEYAATDADEQPIDPVAPRLRGVLFLVVALVSITGWFWLPSLLGVRSTWLYPTLSDYSLLLCVVPAAVAVGVTFLRPRLGMVLVGAAAIVLSWDGSHDVMESIIFWATFHDADFELDLIHRVLTVPVVTGGLGSAGMLFLAFVPDRGRLLRRSLDWLLPIALAFWLAQATHLVIYPLFEPAAPTTWRWRGAGYIYLAVAGIGFVLIWAWPTVGRWFAVLPAYWSTAGSITLYLLVETPSVQLVLNSGRTTSDVLVSALTTLMLVATVVWLAWRYPVRGTCKLPA